MTAITQDQSSLIYLPASANEWTALLSGLGINNPSSYWLCNESSSTLADSGTGGRTLTVNGALTYQAAAPGWTRTGVKFGDDTAGHLLTTSGADATTTSSMLLQIFTVGTNPASGFRALNFIGSTKYECAQLVNGSSGPKLQGRSDAATATGSLQHSNTIVVVTKYDRAHSTLGIYSRGEQIKPTYTAQAAGSSTYLYMLGDTTHSTDATMLYAAYWTGTDAEISDALIQDLIDAVYGDSTTLSKLQAGSTSIKLVAAVEGCSYLLHESTADSAAVLSAWAGSDWTSTLGGLYVELKNSQSVTPWDPFTGGGSCKLTIVPDAADTFGILVNRRAESIETELTATIDRNDTTISVASTGDFSSSGVCYIGTEAIKYTGVGASSFTGCTRGYYSPFGCESSGSGGHRFGNHHRKGQDPNHVQMRPVVTQSPRIWMGKRVGIWAHTYNASTGTLNSRDEAQLVFAGRIAGIADDPNTFGTVIDVEPIHEEIRNGVIGKDIWSATLSDGIDMVTGRTFAFYDGKDGSAFKNATALTVVASGASGTNQMNAGRYSLTALCEKISGWLAGERNASRIYGTYTMCSPVSSNVGLRTKMYWRIEDASSTIHGHWGLSMPGEVMSFLGIRDTDPSSLSACENWGDEKPINTDNITQGGAVPFTNLVFKPNGPGKISQEFSEIMSYSAENERGTFVDQYAYLPANIKGASDSTKQWGLFLINDTTLMVGSYSAGTLTACWLAPFQITAQDEKDASHYIGRRADESEQGPITLRQIFILEASFQVLLANLIYGSGTSGYNHGTYDTLGYGLGLGIPGQMLGGDFELSLSNMPQADQQIAIVIDEPTKFADIFSADLVMRRAFLRWKDEVFELAQWKTPTTADSVAALTESNKAAPSGQVENHRIAALESSEHARAIVKIDYCRDFAATRDNAYLKSIQIEDQTMVDDSGGNVKPYTVALRNTYNDHSNTGSSIEALVKDFIVFMPVLARPFRMITRSIDMRYFEGYGVGDVVTVTDAFARDPLTGVRGITARAGMISRIAYDLGGPNPDGTTRPMGGEVDVMFLDVHRGELYAPSMQIDDTAATGGYTAGTKTVTVYTHKYSHTLSITTNWGWHQKTVYIEESADISYFAVDDRIRVTQIDPATPSAPLTWDDTIATMNALANTFTVTTGFGGWDATKKYRISYQPYTSCTSTQQDYCFEADNADNRVQDSSNILPSHYAVTQEAYDYNTVDSTGLAAYIPTNSYGDGIAHDVGIDRQLVYNVNEYIDRKSAHQSPWLFAEALPGVYGPPACIRPIFLGTEHLSTGVTRSLTVAPWFRSSDGTSTTIAVTISRDLPTSAPSAVSSLDTVRFSGSYAQATWTTSSTTWQTGSDATLSLDVKNLQFGFVWLVISFTGTGECRGLARCIEGVRVVS